MNKIILTILICFACIFSASAQDEQICVMNYNVLNFPSSDATSNNVRAAAFSDIIESSLADVIIVQEMESSAGADMLLNALNINGSGVTYARAPLFFNYNNLGNMMYFNTAKLSFLSQTELPRNNVTVIGGTTNATPRAHSHYRLYANDPNLSVHNDTTYIDVISMHLKASYTNGSGNAIADNMRRLNGCLDLTDYVALMPADRNVIVGGDMNFYDDDWASDTDGNNYIEPGYGEIINNGFVDPLGPWKRNTSAFVDVFTQSTRDGSSAAVLNGNGAGTNGGATGGLDDRFDLQFFDSSISNFSNGVAYVNNSCVIFGNTNVTLNQDALTGNSPLEDQIHLMSDHYPVISKYNLFYPNACAPAPVIASVVTDCTGGTGSGTITINASIANGNTLQYSINGVNYQLSNLFTGLADGPYTVYVLDPSSNCSVQEVNIAVVDCTEICVVDDVSVDLICTSNDFYTLDVIFYAINLSSNQVMIEIDGTMTGPHTVSGAGPYYTISVPSSDFLGDASNNQTNINVIVSDPNAVGSTNGTVVINEVMANAFGGNGDTDNGSGEFVELFCQGPGLCDISCYVVGDGDFAFVVPTNTVLNSGDYYVFHGGDNSVENGFPASNGDFNWNDGINSGNIFPLTGNSSAGILTNSSEEIFLWDNNGTLLDGIIWGGGQDLGTSYSITMPAACGVGTISVTIDDTDPSVFSSSGNSGNDATSLQYEASEVWTGNNTPTPGSANNFQSPVDNAATCIDSTTYNEADLTGCDANINVALRLKVVLEGPYDPVTGLMRTRLNLQNLLPMNQPYNIPPYNYAGTEFVTTFPADVVDWVLVDVRTGINNTDLIAQQVGLLHADGSITQPNSNADLMFNNLPGGQPFYFVVRHRNHLDVMTANAQPAATLITYDFTTGTNKALGSVQKSLVGAAAMIAGDINTDLSIQITDFDEWRFTPAVLYIYDFPDTNMDGIIQTTDYDLWYINRSTLTPTQLAY